MGEKERWERRRKTKEGRKRERDWRVGVGGLRSSVFQGETL